MVGGAGAVSVDEDGEGEAEGIRLDSPAVVGISTASGGTLQTVAVGTPMPLS